MKEKRYNNFLKAKQTLEKMDSFFFHELQLIEILFSIRDFYVS